MRTTPIDMSLTMAIPLFTDNDNTNCHRWSSIMTTSMVAEMKTLDARRRWQIQYWPTMIKPDVCRQGLFQMLLESIDDLDKILDNDNLNRWRPWQVLPMPTPTTPTTATPKSRRQCRWKWSTTVTTPMIIVDNNDDFFLSLTNKFPLVLCPLSIQSLWWGM